LKSYRILKRNEIVLLGDEYYQNHPSFQTKWCKAKQTVGKKVWEAKTDYVFIEKFRRPTTKKVVGTAHNRLKAEIAALENILLTRWRATGDAIVLRVAKKLRQLSAV